MDDYISALKHALDRINQEKVQEAIKAIHRNQSMIYFAGNGGSFSTAEHMACDWAKFARVPRRTYVLGGNRALSTAWSNDFDYETALVEEAKALRVDHNDLLVVVSTSGESLNVVNLIKKWPGTSILFTGDLESSASEVAAITIFVEVEDIRIVEDVHLVLNHIIAGNL